MARRIQIILAFFFPIYLSIVLFTDVSLAGYWTDVIFSIVLSALSIKLVLLNKIAKRWLSVLVGIVNLLCSLVVVILLVLNLLNPFVIDTFKLRSFYYQSVDGRLFNAYFKPVGAYSGGYGNFWISEVPKYFPIIERKVYWDRTVRHDFGKDVFEGQPIDNKAAVCQCIKDNIIDK